MCYSAQVVQVFRKLHRELQWRHRLRWYMQRRIDGGKSRPHDSQPIVAAGGLQHLEPSVGIGYGAAHDAAVGERQLHGRTWDQRCGWIVDDAAQPQPWRLSQGRERNEEHDRYGEQGQDAAHKIGWVHGAREPTQSRPSE